MAGKPFERNMEQLVDLGGSNDPALNTFAGTAIYRTEFIAPDTAVELDLGEVRGISEATLNGHPLGTRWYGRHVYAIASALVSGKNVLSVKLTTVLFNYCRSLKGNRTAT